MQMLESFEAKAKETVAGARPGPVPPTAKESERFTFPDLVYKELIAVLLAMVVLCIWSVAMDAPLKEIADPNWTENPAKAPWYFVGLQELLVYFDPWIAGVLVPGLIIFGLAVLPYIDPNPAGSGAYNLRKRRLVGAVFLFGYALWFFLIAIGQYLRGPSWQLYWPWEDWSVAKAAEESLVNLPNTWGTLLLVGYFAVGLGLPALISRSHFRKMGALRYLISWTLALMMFGVVAKMVLRICFDVKYIVSTTAFSI